MEKIDIVIPYVNGIDPEWQKIHNIYRKNVDYTRFDGHDILKYVLRSIDKYLPWINKVHLLVMQESQIPETYSDRCSAGSSHREHRREPEKQQHRKPEPD